jgi:hypothetical protein
MIRFRALLIVLAAVTGCGDTPAPATPSAAGSAEFALIVQNDISLDSVQYVITKGSDDYRREDVDVAGSSEIKFQVGGLSAAADYAISVLATTTNGVSCTSSPESFAIKVAEVTSLSMTLACGDEGTSRGNAHVDVTVSIAGCPEVDGVTVLPSSVVVGATIMLQGYSTIKGADFALARSPVLPVLKRALPAAPRDTTHCHLPSPKMAARRTPSRSRSTAPVTVRCTSANPEPLAPISSLKDKAVWSPAPQAASPRSRLLTATTACRSIARPQRQHASEQTAAASVSTTAPAAQTHAPEHPSPLASC